MAAYCYESNAQDVLCDDPVEYCSCVSMVDNYQVPYHDRRCGICHRHCPDEKAIYLALKDIESIGELGKRWAKKTTYRSGTIKRALASIQDRADVKVLVDQYGMDTLYSVVRRLLKNGVFTSDFIAQKRFPGLTVAIAEEEAMSKEPTEVTQEKSDWELLVAAEAPEEASVETPDEEPEEAAAKASEEEPEEATAKASEEECIEDKVWPEMEPSFTTEIYPAEACEAPADETKPPEKEACGARVQKEQNTICLPFSSQHKLMIHLQEVLETACFAYGQRKLPTLLRKHGWNCAEAVALRTWMDQFASIQHTFDTEPSRDLLQSVIGIQDTVVNRTPIDSSRMKKFLDDAVELTDILKMKDYGDMVKKVRLDIGKAIEDLSREEQEAEDHQEKKLKRIAEERMKLDEREAEVREYGIKNKRECQKSAELEVKKLLNEAKKSLETTTFFMQLAQ
ncbi:hypothetical protein V3481_019613 [Fusarium oxysporum f. sp. vasinfectum]